MDRPLLPHHRLKAYGVAIQLLEAVKAAKIRDAYLRDHAMRSAKSACLNAAEGAGRVTRPDKARAFTIARGEACEAASAVEVAVTAGDADAGALGAVLEHADHFVAMMTALIR
jgi:four helix bundle protein